MSDIQAQIEQQRTDFKEKSARAINKYNEAEFDEDFDALIRSVVEICCGAAKRTHDKYPITVTWNALDFVEQEIRSGFAWLEEYRADKNTT